MCKWEVMALKSQKSFEQEREPALYLVPTPIGNLEDMTYRAVRILREADVIAAEDTRNTKKLCNHFEIQTPLISYHEHNRQQSLDCPDCLRNHTSAFLLLWIPEPEPKGEEKGA